MFDDANLGTRWMRIMTKGVGRKTMNLAESTFADYSVEVEVIERDFSCEIDVLGGCTTHDRIVGRGMGESNVVRQRWEAYKKQGEIIMPD
jgi:hypothetical protein